MSKFRSWGTEYWSNDVQKSIVLTQMEKSLQKFFECEFGEYACSDFDIDIVQDMNA